LHRIILTIVSAALIGFGTVAARAERVREIVAYDDVRIDVIAEGNGPLVVLLPGRGRTSEDFDQVAAGLAKSGFRVLRPQPRGADGSSGPMQGLTLHDSRATLLKSSSTKGMVPR
jgi:pimeloyl-ACP methyl ester carboxylesterase